jgi:hypothetical protein
VEIPIVTRNSPLYFLTVSFPRGSVTLSPKDGMP